MAGVIEEDGAGVVDGEAMEDMVVGVDMVDGEVAGEEVGDTMVGIAEDFGADLLNSLAL